MSAVLVVTVMSKCLMRAVVSNGIFRLYVHYLAASGDCRRT